MNKILRWLGISLIGLAGASGHAANRQWESAEWIFDQIATPSNPVANKDKLYCKSDDKVYRLTSGGGEVSLLDSSLVGNLSETGSSIFTVSGTGKTLGNATVQANLNSGQIYIGSASNFPVGQTMSGDATLSVAGSLAVGSHKILSSKIRQSAGLSLLGVSAAITADVADITGTLANQVMRMDMQGTTIAFGTLNLASSNAVAGVLPVANGGTGAASLTLNNVVLGNGTSAVQLVAPGSNGNLLTSNGTTWQSTAAGAASYTAPTITNLTSTGTQTGWVFTVTSANATVGATYTNNSNTYTVQGTISSGTILFMSGTGATSGGTLTKSGGTGDASITFSSKVASATYTAPNPAVLYLRVMCSGAGGGGGGGGAGNGNGTDGGESYFGANLLTMHGGAHGVGGAGGAQGNGGGAVLNSPFIGVAWTGMNGQGSDNIVNTQGGMGGSCYNWGGAGAGGGSGGGANAIAGTGAGGGGGGGTGAAGGGAGGGAGGCVDGIYPNPSAAQTFPYALGTAGSGGAGADAGGNAGSPSCLVYEMRQ